MNTLYCYYDDIKKVNEGIGNDDSDWNEGLVSACAGGHLFTAQLMILRGANDWNGGLRLACWYGQIELVKLMILNGANDWNNGLYNACYKSHYAIMRLIILNNGKIGQYYISNLKWVIIEKDPLYYLIKHKALKRIPIWLLRQLRSII